MRSELAKLMVRSQPLQWVIRDQVEPATRVTMSAVPRKRPNFAVQGNDAMGQKQTHALQQKQIYSITSSVRKRSEL
jgi:hypothetical protein